MHLPRARRAVLSACLLRDCWLREVQTTVFAHCRRYARAILVTANTALAIAIAPGAPAQDVSGPPWWSELPLPDEPPQTFFIQNVQRTLASAFDPTLPATSFDTWLWSTFAPVVEPVRPPRVDWRVS